MKRLITLVFWLIMVAAVTTLFIFANKKQEKQVCKEFKIEIDYEGAPELVSKTTLRQEITQNKLKIKGNETGKLEIEKIHSILNSNPFVKKATLTVGVNGIVKAAVVQRKPLVRVADLQGRQFYIDEEGFLMPLSHEFSARTVIASGNIRPVNKISNVVSKDKPQYQNLRPDLKSIYLIAMALKKDPFYEALIEQLYLDENQEFQLYPKIGHQSIIIGDTTGIAEKLRNLKIFYTEGMKQRGWDAYHTINLKFRNQIVCSKPN